MMVLSYFVRQPANQPASHFAGIWIRDAARQLPLKQKVLLYRDRRICLFWGGTRALPQRGVFPFPSWGNDAALTSHQCFHGWELQGENSFRNMHMLHADLFFLLVKKKETLAFPRQGSGVLAQQSPAVLCESPFDIPALPYKAPLWGLQLCAQLRPV